MGFENKKIPKELIKSVGSQEIIVTGSKLFAFLERSAVWIKLFSFTLGILTLANVLASPSSKYSRINEILTLIVVGLLLLQAVSVPLLKKMKVKKLLKEFWGTKEIVTTMKYPTDIDPTKDFGDVSKSSDSFQIESTKITWTTIKAFPVRKLLTVQQSVKATEKKWKKYQDVEGNFNTAFIPMYIIVDTSKGTITFDGKINVLYTKEKYPDKRQIFTFHYKEKMAEWSGIFPEYPFYGEWIWDKKLAPKIKEETVDARNSHKKVTKTVKKVFKNK